MTGSSLRFSMCFIALKSASGATIAFLSSEIILFDTLNLVVVSEISVWIHNNLCLVEVCLGNTTTGN